MEGTAGSLVGWAERRKREETSKRFRDNGPYNTNNCQSSQFSFQFIQKSYHNELNIKESLLVV